MICEHRGNGGNQKRYDRGVHHRQRHVEKFFHRRYAVDLRRFDNVGGNGRHRIRIHQNVHAEAHPDVIEHNRAESRIRVFDQAFHSLARHSEHKLGQRLFHEKLIHRYHHDRRNDRRQKQYHAEKSRSRHFFADIIRKEYAERRADTHGKRKRLQRYLHHRAKFRALRHHFKRRGKVTRRPCHRSRKHVERLKRI